VKKNQTSVALAVVVRVTEPPAALNEPPEYANDTVLPPVPSFKSTRIKDDTAPALVIVSVALPFKVAVNTVPRDRSIVAAVPVLPIADAVSTIFLPVSVVVDVIAAPVNVPVNVGDALNTKLPEPVSSKIIEASCADVVAANWLRLPDSISLIALTIFDFAVVSKLLRTPTLEFVVARFELTVETLEFVVERFDTTVLTLESVLARLLLVVVILALVAVLLVTNSFTAKTILP